MVSAWDNGVSTRLATDKNQATWRPQNLNMAMARAWKSYEILLLKKLKKVNQLQFLSLPWPRLGARGWTYRIIENVRLSNFNFWGRHVMVDSSLLPIVDFPAICVPKAPNNLPEFLPVNYDDKPPV